MKKTVVMFCMVLFVMASALHAQAIKGGTMYVAAKTIELKASSGFFAAVKGTLAYGATVTVLQIKGDWAEVRSVAKADLTGWTAVANLSAKRIVSGATAGATANEVALAGKGFNQEVENAYKAKGRLNYADVDRTEAQKVSKKELQDFITAGRLSQGDKK
jgi:hypothetical protein